MPININDPVTGDSFQYFGNQTLSQPLARELIGASIVEASQELLDGSYKKDALGKDVDDFTAVKRLERNTALQLRVPIGNIDATSGISDSDRLALGLRPTMGQKLDHLRTEYGYRNVQAVPVNGSYRLIIKTEGEGQNAKYKYVNEEGLDFGDITQFGAGAAIPIVAATIATVAAPILLPTLAVAGWGSAAALATVSAGTYFGAGVLQDSAVASYDGSVPDFAEIAKRRGVESAFAFFPEMAMIRGGQWLSGFAGSGADDVAKLLRSDIETLKTNFTKVLDDGTELVPSLDAGLGGLSSRAGAATEKASSANSSAIRKLYQNNIDELDTMLSALNGGSPRPIQEVVEVARDKLTQQLTKLGDDVAAFDPQLQNAVQKILQTKLKRMGGTERLYRSRPSGDKIQKGLQDSFNTAQKKKRELFEDVTARATDEGIFYDVESVLGAMRRAIAKGGSGLDEIDVDAARAFATSMEKSGLSDEAVLKALRDKLPLEFKGGMKDFTPVKTMSYKQLDDVIKKYAERADFGDIKAVGNSAGFARLMRKELTGVRDKALKGTETQKALSKANEFYRGKYGQFIRSDVKPLIKPDFGSGYGNIPGEAYTVMGGEAVMNKIFSNPKTLREVLNALPENAPFAGAFTKAEATAELRTSYLSSIGLNGTVKLGKGMKINVNNDIMSVLFPRNWEIKVKAFEQLIDLVRSTGKVLEIDDAIFREILSLGTPTQAKNALKIAESKIKAAAKLATEEQNKLFQAIIKKQGNLSAEDAMEAVGSLLNYSSDEISALVKVIQGSSPEFGLATLRNKLSTEIVELAQPTKVSYPVTSRGKPLFDADIMLTKLKDVKIRKVATEVLGKEWVENMEAIARVAKYSTAEPRKLPGVRPVISPGSGGMQTTFVVGDLLPDVGRFLYGRFAATPGLKQVLSRKTPDEAAMVFRQWLPFFMATDEGLKALALYSRDHPELSVYIQEELANLGNLAMEQDTAAIRRGEMSAPAPQQGN
jgi:hypothetical protein